MKRAMRIQLALLDNLIWVILLLFFVRLDSVYEGVFIFMVIVSLLIALLLLIMDMDNPFEYERTSFADVDFTPLFEAGGYLGEASPA